MIHRSHLKAIPRFSSMSDDALSWFEQRFIRKAYDKGDHVFYQGSDSDAFYLVASGIVRISRYLKNGRELILGLFQEGQVLGEVMLLEGKPFPANAYCAEDTCIFVLPRVDYLAAYHEIPEFAMGAVRDLTLRNRDLLQRVMELGAGSVEERLVRVLQTLSATLGEPHGDGTLIPGPVTKQDISNMVCARYETVIRTLTKWQESGMIEEENGRIVIPAGSELASAKSPYMGSQ